MGIGARYTVEVFQSNHEGVLIDKLHERRSDIDGVVFNPGAFTHTSYALHDAIEAIEVPTVEVHISNVKEREPWRATSVIAPACIHQIYGRGIDGYLWALRHLVGRRLSPPTRVSYGDDPQQFLDYRQGTNDQLAVLIHGGFWRHNWAFDALDLNAVDLNNRGWHVANLEFRRVGNGGGWPTTSDDIHQAARVALASCTMPIEQISVIGHSAGGQLALQLARHIGDSRPTTVVSMGGVNDMVKAVESNLGEGAALDYLNGADPEEASPLHNPPECPVIIAHGSHDDRVPVEYGRAYAATNGATLIETAGGDHFPIPRHVRRDVDRLGRCFSPPSDLRLCQPPLRLRG